MTVLNFTLSPQSTQKVHEALLCLPEFSLGSDAATVFQKTGHSWLLTDGQEFVVGNAVESPNSKPYGAPFAVSSVNTPY